MKVSVVIPTYNREFYLRRCLFSLLKQDYPPTEFEILICDDAADERIRVLTAMTEIHTEIPIRYIPVTESQGPAGARNRGAMSARGEILAFIDDDCIPDTHWLGRGVNHIIETGCDAVTGRVVVNPPSPPTDYELNESRLEEAEFITANLFITKKVFLEVGCFNELFKAAWREDSDLHFKLLKGKYRIERNSEAVVYHPVRRAGFGVSILQQRKSEYEALLKRLHPELYKEKIGVLAPPLYYLFLLGIVLIAVGAFYPPLFITGTVITLSSWIIITVNRLKLTSKAPSHIVEMLVTSAVIPVMSLYYRGKGNIKYNWQFKLREK